MNFSDFVNDIRLDYARELLITKGKKHTIEAIASMSGFKRDTFYRLFREKFGIQPGKLIKMTMSF